MPDVSRPNSRLLPIELGMIVSTPSALDVCSLDRITSCLALHATGDWGCIDAEDAQANNEALSSGERILSAYPIDPAKPSEGFGKNTIWIITEADRSVTTILLPDDY